MHKFKITHIFSLKADLLSKAVSLYGFPYLLRALIPGTNPVYPTIGVTTSSILFCS